MTAVGGKAGKGWQAGDYLDRPLRELLDDVGGTAPVPAAGSICAVTGALAAALVAKVAGKSSPRMVEAESLAARATELAAELAPLAQADAESYTRFVQERRDRSSGNDGADDNAWRSEQPQDHDAAADHAALDVPIAVAQAGAELAGMAETLARHGNPNLRFDAAGAARLAASAARVSAWLAATNSRDAVAARTAALNADRAERLAGNADRAAARK
ncbi:cyclodeaminase/cyclohydrolase family protein [Saxibacter everestensis]|uniref:Cyclodeaminase/cyclohydrolase family protein n=1 Tax=Saxibacter everestensis TaxID=2909229 RepID=A0ABY8QZ83_9MICO|nr:cyclodeaminase/cyclohydrolase family protein [Brevibacteriaceae bacterium ZFBP1038]